MQLKTLQLPKTPPKNGYYKGPIPQPPLFFNHHVPGVTKACFLAALKGTRKNLQTADPWKALVVVSAWGVYWWFLSIKPSKSTPSGGSRHVVVNSPSAREEIYSLQSTRLIFDRLAHSSIMRLNESSMGKLFGKPRRRWLFHGFFYEMMVFKMIFNRFSMGFIWFYAGFHMVCYGFCEVYMVSYGVLWGFTWFSLGFL